MGIMSLGYRGDRSNIQLIILGLAALTNYLIDQHPLTREDNACEESSEESESDDEVEKILMCESASIRHQKSFPMTYESPAAHLFLPGNLADK